MVEKQTLISIVRGAGYVAGSGLVVAGTAPIIAGIAESIYAFYQKEYGASFAVLASTAFIIAPIGVAMAVAGGAIINRLKRRSPMHETADEGMNEGKSITESLTAPNNEATLTEILDNSGGNRFYEKRIPGLNYS